MAIRSDISINWDVSPRIITIAAPSTEILMQDLYDTLRFLEIVQMDEHSIVEGSGKESLGGTLKVGLTLTLHNALVAFEARSGPSYESCFVRGGNLVAVDDTDVFVDSPIYPTPFTNVILFNSVSATLQTITSGSGLSTEQSNQLAAVFESTDKKLLTKALWMALKS